MDALLQSFGKVLTDLGLPGVFIGVSLLANYLYFRSNEEKNKTIIDLTRETVKANEATVAALNSIKDLFINGRNSGA